MNKERLLKTAERLEALSPDDFNRDWADWPWNPYDDWDTADPRIEAAAFEYGISFSDAWDLFVFDSPRTFDDNVSMSPADFAKQIREYVYIGDGTSAGSWRRGGRPGW